MKSDYFRRMFGAYMPSEWPPQDVSPDAARSSLDPPTPPMLCRDFASVELRAAAMRALKPGQMLVMGDTAMDPDWFDMSALTDYAAHRALTPRSAPSYFEHHAAKTPPRDPDATVEVQRPEWAGGPSFTGTARRYRKD